MSTGSLHTLSQSLNEQVARLNQVTDQVISILQRCGVTIPTQLLDNLAELGSGFTHLSRLVAQRESSHDNLRAMLDTTQVINSSLKLDEVLRIVMDTLVRLIRASGVS